MPKGQPRMAQPHLAEKATAAKGQDQLIQEMLSNDQFWYQHDQSITRFAMEVVSANPDQVSDVCETLVLALARGNTKAGPMDKDLQVSDRTFETRDALRLECRKLLKSYVGDLHQELEPNKVVPLSPQDLVFMRDLIKHHPHWLEKSKGLVRLACGAHPEIRIPCFLTVKENGTVDSFSYVRCVENIPSREARAQCSVVESLCMILKLHPGVCGAVAKMLDERFPKARTIHSIELYRNWTRSLLRLCTSISAFTDFIIGLLIRKMLELDVEITKVEDELAAEAEGQLDLMAQILDTMMLCYFEFLEVHVSKPGSEQVTPMEGRLVSAMIEVFRGTILLTHQSRFVQFLYFYLASLRPNWTEAVLSCCLTSAFSPTDPMPKRLISGAYLASFVARASFLTPQYALRTAQYLSQFAREQVQVVEGLVAARDLRNNKVALFLSIVQAVCYLLCFKAEAFAKEVDPASGQTALQLVLPPGGGDAAFSEAFTPVLQSPCRPITLININVARQFCKTIRRSCPNLSQQLMQQLAWHRQAARSGGAETESDAGKADDDTEGPVTLPGLELFFPFDPYRLRNSHMFLGSIYSEWQEEEAEESEVDEGSAPGYLSEAAGPRARLGSIASRADAEEEDEEADVDFMETVEATDRGFAPSVGPSPSFGPRHSDVLMDPMSPLALPMEGVVEDDRFQLPSAALHVDNPVLQMFTSSESYRGIGA